ncbi:MAG: hypothetical protein AAGJ80_05405 [Cyanobacteria bacterium J06553_1]
MGLHEDSPKNIATDGLTAYPRAIKKELGEDVEPEVRPCTASPVKQNHRRIKHRSISDNFVCRDVERAAERGGLCPIAFTFDTHA